MSLERRVRALEAIGSPGGKPWIVVSVFEGSDEADSIAKAVADGGHASVEDVNIVILRRFAPATCLATTATLNNQA